MQQKNKHTWLVHTDNGLQFKNCLNCGELHTLEYHFDVIHEDIIECKECGKKHEIFALY